MRKHLVITLDASSRGYSDIAGRIVAVQSMTEFVEEI